MGKRKNRLNGTHHKAQKTADVSLPRWDQGATGPANRIGLVTEERGELDPTTGKMVNPNGVKGSRRVDMLETYYKRGLISDRGYTAGEALRDAYTATQRSKGSELMERVDASPKPDAFIDIQVDRLSRYIAISRHIPAEDQRILIAVVGEGRTVAHLRQYHHLRHEAGLAHLRAALDRLADAMECGKKRK